MNMQVSMECSCVLSIIVYFIVVSNLLSKCSEIISWLSIQIYQIVDVIPFIVILLHVIPESLQYKYDMPPLMLTDRHFCLFQGCMTCISHCINLALCSVTSAICLIYKSDCYYTYVKLHNQM